MSLLDRIKLHKQYTFDGNMDELIEEFRILKKPRIERLDESNFKLRPFVSLGTLVVRGFAGVVDGINVKATLTTIDEHKQLITFTTKVRPEHLFIAIIFPLLLLLFLSDKKLEEISFIFGLWIVFHLWFQLIFRIQERMVMGKVVEKLSLQEYSSAVNERMNT